MSTERNITEQNIKAYNKPAVVESYLQSNELSAVEHHVFSTYINNGDKILDIGVGGGRTTPYLSSKSSLYVGIDYADSMLNACRDRFPSLEFYYEDASDLKRFDDNTFDVVVFSFNGIDCIGTDEARARCLHEVRRVLRPGGRFIFSSHNARWLGPRPTKPTLRRLTQINMIQRILFDSATFAKFAMRTLLTKAFYKGAGYRFNPAEGGLILYYSTPDVIKGEIEAAGFKMIEYPNWEYPRETSIVFARWYYYVIEAI